MDCIYLFVLGETERQEMNVTMKANVSGCVDTGICYVMCYGIQNWYWAGYTTLSNSLAPPEKI